MRTSIALGLKRVWQELIVLVIVVLLLSHAFYHSHAFFTSDEAEVEAYSWHPALSRLTDDSYTLSHVYNPNYFGSIANSPMREQQRRQQLQDFTSSYVNSADPELPDDAVLIVGYYEAILSDNLLAALEGRDLSEGFALRAAPEASTMTIPWADTYELPLIEADSQGFVLDIQGADPVLYLGDQTFYVLPWSHRAAWNHVKINEEPGKLVIHSPDPAALLALTDAWQSEEDSLLLMPTPLDKQLSLRQQSYDMSMLIKALVPLMLIISTVTLIYMLLMLIRRDFHKLTIEYRLGQSFAGVVLQLCILAVATILPASLIWYPTWFEWRNNVQGLIDQGFEMEHTIHPYSFTAWTLVILVPLVVIWPAWRLKQEWSEHL